MARALPLLLLSSLALGAQTTSSPPASLARTPPMGWASWNHFFCQYDEQTIRQQAHALVSTGMRDAGYRYALIQECIAPARDDKGNLAPDAKKFPHGMKLLVDYIHAKGLKAGIYTDVGPNTCASNPKSKAASITRIRTPRSSPPGAWT